MNRKIIAGLKSPFTGGDVSEVTKEEEIDFKGEKIIVPIRYYVCEDTGEEFTTSEQDEEWYDYAQKAYTERSANLALLH